VGLGLPLMQHGDSVPRRTWQLISALSTGKDCWWLGRIFGNEADLLPESSSLLWSSVRRSRGTNRLPWATGGNSNHWTTSLPHNQYVSPAAYVAWRIKKERPPQHLRKLCHESIGWKRTQLALCKCFPSKRVGKDNAVQYSHRPQELLLKTQQNSLISSQI
jgi:hypothetical protein